VDGEHPKREAVAKWRKVFENDPAWYPGKICAGAKKRGPAPKFTPQKRRAVAQSAMALKARGVEPSAPAVVEMCPQATLNPDTQEPFTSKYILQVFKTLCYDKDPANPWRHQFPLSKTALPPLVVAARCEWGRQMQRLNLSPGWFFQNCIWVDPCSTILPGSARSIADQKQANLGKSKRWGSTDARDNPRNQRAPPYAEKQAGWGDKRVWWFVIVTRGKVHFEVMPDMWQQNGEGMAYLVDKLPAILRKMLGRQARLPRVMFTDRGPGFYHASSGRIVDQYHQALTRCKFRPFAGEDASWQPPDMPDLFMHETVVGWARRYFRKHPFKKRGNLVESERSFREILANCADYINSTYKVNALCHSMPARVTKLLAKKGLRLKY
jgi:hypothetical protein